MRIGSVGLGPIGTALPARLLRAHDLLVSEPRLGGQDTHGANRQTGTVTSVGTIRDGGPVVIGKGR